ncbi:putative secreted protein (Por secretion system target) [Mangrovibacterium diazotrophicum]|uniref:Putative secreted protein (Por secretion system target) n=1 Tax=Mangrovibacterium diazotrophicum TaxID=1261403 RepID=A0A419W500_9BACT|nr:putative secreted protein (Por secretion system target) [Mangrovibacterium diazotrophicum]
MKAFLIVILILIAHQFGSAQTSDSTATDQQPVKVDRVFPNPVSDYIFVELSSDKFAKAEFMLMDVLGNPVQQWEAVELTPGTQKIRLNLNDFHSGLYLLKVKIGKDVFVNRLRKV